MRCGFLKLHIHELVAENAYKTRHPAAMPDIMAGPPGCDTITLPDALRLELLVFYFSAIVSKKV